MDDMIRSFKRAMAFATISDEESDRIEEEERLRTVERRISCSGIPGDMRGADITACPEGVKEFAREVWRGMYADLVLYGKTGRGKTYAACAVLVALAQKTTVRFATAQDIVAHAKSWDGAEWLDRCRGVGVLVIDDLGNEEQGRGSGEVKNVLDARQQSRRPTVITTQLVSPGNTTGITSHYANAAYGEALRSRISARSVRKVAFVGEDRRLR